METNKPNAEGKSNEATNKVEPIVKKELEVSKTKLQFPREFSKIVYIRRRERMGNIPGQNPDDAKLKIGSSFKGSSVNRGLTFKEEVRFLQEVLGINASSPNWEKSTKDYWCNISKPVPPKEGVKLEVGLKYITEEDYLEDQNKKVNENGVIEDCKGTPINLSDYILWRYCLVYNEVANSIEFVGNSPKINFYLFNKDKEIKDKKAIIDQKRSATKLLFSNLGDREWVEHVLRNLIARDSASKYTIRDLPEISEDERDILLEEYVQEKTAEFLVLGNDKNLQLKSFIEIAIVLGKLSRIPNTATITLDGQVIGNTLEETVTFLLNPKNNDIYTTLKAQVKVGV